MVKKEQSLSSIILKQLFSLIIRLPFIIVASAWIHIGPLLTMKIPFVKDSAEIWVLNFYPTWYL